MPHTIFATIIILKNHIKVVRLSRAAHFIECNRKYANERSGKKVQYHDHCWLVYWLVLLSREYEIEKSLFNSNEIAYSQKYMHAIMKCFARMFMSWFFAAIVVQSCERVRTTCKFVRVLFILMVGCNSSFANFVWFEMNRICFLAETFYWILEIANYH